MLKRIAKDLLARDKEGWISRRSYFSLSPGTRPGTEVVVSLTSIPERLSRVHVVVETLMRQTYPPERIVLWLSREQFGDKDRLPLALELQRKRGLEIRFCNHTWPHKKLLPALAEWPEHVIVTCDDDLLYPADWLEGLVSNHRKFPRSVVCHRAREIKLDAQGFPLPYDLWPLAKPTGDYPRIDLLPTGGGGVLYPPHALHPDVFDTERALILSPRADDIWFRFMGIRAGVTVSRTADGDDAHTELEGSQRNALKRVNLHNGGNDHQMAALLKHYNVRLQDFFDSGRGSVS